MDYKIFLDDFCEEIFHEMETISNGIHGHECLISAQDKDEAADIVCAKLKKFITDQFQEF